MSTKPSAFQNTTKLRRLTQLGLLTGICLACFAIFLNVRDFVAQRNAFQRSQQLLQTRLSQGWDTFQKTLIQHTRKPLSSQDIISLQFAPSGKLKSPMHLALPIPPLTYIYHHPHAKLATGEVIQAQRYWKKGLSYLQSGNTQKALRQFRQIRKGSVDIHGLPYDLLIPWQLHKQGFYPFTEQLLRRLAQGRYPLSIRKHILAQLQKEKRLTPQTDKLFRQIQVQVRHWQNLKRPNPHKRVHSASLGTSEGFVIRLKNGHLLWFSQIRLQKFIQELLQRPPKIGYITQLTFHPPSPKTLYQGHKTGPVSVYVAYRLPYSWYELSWRLALILLLLSLWLVTLFTLQRIVRQEIALREERQRFAASVSHELRTPLTSLCLSMEMLADEQVPTEKVPRYHKRILREIWRLRELVENVIAFYRSESALLHDPSAPKQLLRVDQVAQEVLLTLEIVAKSSENTLHLEIETEEAQMEILADPIAFRRVLRNIVENALRYAPGSPVTITIHSGPHIEIRDRGPGIPEAQLEEIFAPFTRGKGQQVRGLGLGLALAKEVIESTGGTLTAHNDPEGGAVFTIQWSESTTRTERKRNNDSQDTGHRR